MDPYREHPRPAPAPTRDRGESYRASRARLVKVGLAIALFGMCVPTIARHCRTTTAPGVPPELLTAGATFPLADVQLPPSVPLDPLLVADAPDRLSVLAPRGSASNLRPGAPFVVRFNRPMVEGAAVGKPASGQPLLLTESIAGRATWTSRSSLSFEADAASWRGRRTVGVSLSPALRSLAGEEIEDALEHTLVFDDGPRIVGRAGSGRVVAGESLGLLFSGRVDRTRIEPGLMVYEVDGGRRMLPFSIATSSVDDRGRTRVDLALRSQGGAGALEPGARLAVAVAPPLAYAGSEPQVVAFELAPRPRIEGIDCPKDARDASACAHAGPPGKIVDIGEALRVRASEDLAPLEPTSVRVSPPLDELRTSIEDRRTIVVEGAFAPGQVYEVRFEALRDHADHALVRTPPLAVRSAGKRPEVRVAQGRLTYEAEAATTLPLSAIHVDGGEARVASVPEGAELAALIAPGRFVSGRDGASTFSARPLAPLVPGARANRWGTGSLDWSALAPARTNMAVLSLLPDERARGARDVAGTFVQRTDLGIDAKVLPRGVLAWVTSIATARPVAGAQVTFADAAANPIGLVTADERGVAWLPVFDATRLEREVLVRATHAGDRAVMVVDPRTSMTPRHFGVAPGSAAVPDAEIVATVITDRGIVRPGEALHTKVLARERGRDGLVAKTDGAVRIVLFGPDHEAPLDERTATLSAFGTVDATFHVDDAAHTGDYRVEAHVDGARIGSARFVVGDYRPPTFRVDLSSPTPGLVEGDELRAEVGAALLFGPPAAGRSARYAVTRVAGSDPAGWSAYTFSPVDTSVRVGTMASGELTLDAEGRATLAAPVAIGAALRAEAVVEVTVNDVSGQATSARHRVALYPAAFEIGLRAVDRWVAHGAALDLDAVVVDHDGKPVRGRQVESRIVREGWHAYWEANRHDDDGSEDGGSDDDAPPAARRTRRAEIAHTCKLTSGDDPVHCRWTPARPGTYLLESTTRDDAGRVAIASQRVYVAGPNEQPDRDRPGAAVALTPKRDRLRVGDVAEIAFESPFPEAEAFVQVHRDGLLHTETRRVGPGGNVLRIPVTADMVPNAFVSLSLVRPRTGPPTGAIDLDAPDLRVGLTELTVRPDASPLAVRVDVATSSAAGSDVPVEVHVTDEAGRGVRAELAVYAVDEGTLRVTGYTTPSAEAGFFPAMSPSFAWEDLRRALVSRVTEPLLPGAGGDGASSPQRMAPEQLERFEPTPLWLPQLVTDEAGRASAVLHLPERATQYRVMVVAADAGVRTASSEASIVATMPVVVRPALPVQATVGDRFEAVAFVHNASSIGLDVHVTPRVSGDARPTQTLHIPAQGEARVATWIDATHAGDLDVAFATESDHARTETVSRVHVSPFARAARSSVVGAIERDRTVTLHPPTGTLGPIALTVAAHPFVGFDVALEDLLSTRGVGVEGAAAGLVALAAYARLDAGVKPERLSPDEIEARAALLVERLAHLQTSSGGFGVFTADEDADAYLTAFALHALSAASRAGFRVRDDVRIRAQRHLAARVRGTDFLDGGTSGTGHDELAFALRVLAEEAAPEIERANALFNQRERLGPFGLAQLALALGDDDFRRVTLAADALRVLFTRDDEARRPDVLRWYDGSARTLGAVLEAASEVEAVHDATPELASRLLLARQARTRASGGPWAGPHETSAALAGLAAYAGIFARDRAVEPTVTVDGVALAPAYATSRLARFEIPGSEANGPPRALRITTPEVAWFALDATTTTALGEHDEIARGKVTTLHRRLEDAAGRPLAPGAHVRLGDLVRVRLFVFTEETPPPFVSIRDRMAGGLEPVDPGLVTSPRDALSALLGMGPDDDVIDARAHYAMRSLGLVSHRTIAPGEATFHLAHGNEGLHEITYGLRATTVGTFVVPPAELAARYAPDFVARSAMSTLVVDP